MSASKAMEFMKLSDYQVKVLENCFNRDTKHPDGATLTLIAAECGLTEEETLKWFDLRNAQWREAEGLPAKLGSVLD
ncbi:homeodomain-only protein [Anabas testudineus]|uniref:Homeodomain-only protein n=1 Tax=Anabas testudineus TaxID=64144 RepID=A0A3Q1HLP7_ANATE|nr:homeodomain-only protein [Anabas testudineus]